MEIILDELTGSMPDLRQLARVSIRLLAALLVGALIGFQRELTGKPAGLRTHMLVALGTAVFVLIPVELQLGGEPLARVVEGVATGLGFLGAGAILKLATAREIHGLTTAAGIWMTAAASAAIAAGMLGIALIAVFLAWIVLSALLRVEERMGTNRADVDNEA